MKANTQFDLHPDAESLNAFAEQALAERERGEIVAHLAGCGRCRQIVFLAQEAAGAMEPAEAVAVHRVVRRKSWLRSWWFVWAPTAALAATVAVAVYVHVRRVEIEQEMAKVTTEATPQIGASKGAPAAAAREQKADAGAAAAPEPTRPASEKRKALPPSPQAPTIAASASGTSASESYGMRASNRSAADLPTSASGTGTPAQSTMAEAKPEPAESAMGESQVQTSGADESRAMDRVMNRAADRAMATRKSAEAKTEESERSVQMQAAAAAPAAQASPPPAPSYPPSAVHGVSGAFAAYKAQPSELPSGLPAVSSVAAMNRMLAIDPAGSVFLSEDAGMHWKSVEKHWEGRAITVRVQEAPGAAGGAARSTPEVFEIVNDRGEVWVSTDGRNWRLK